MATLHAEPTPNPNSIKFASDDGHFLEEGMAAYSSEEEAEENPLARRLFSVPGVDDVFITPAFVTVSKRASTDWNQVKPKIESVLQEYLEES